MENEKKVGKIKAIDRLSESEKGDVKFLVRQLEAYTEQVDDYENHTEYKKYLKLAEKALADEDKKAAKKEKQKSIEANLSKQTASGATSGIYYVGDLNKYLLYDDDKNSWITLLDVAVSKIYGFQDKAEHFAFDEGLRKAGRMKHKTTNTFGVPNPNELNLLSKNGWLSLVDVSDEDKPDEFIENILLSVTGENVKGKEHIEEVVVAKFLHPEDPNIPAQIIFGSGAAFKNRFIEDILGTVFGPRHVVVVGSSEMFGFNGQLLGKVVVMLDEAVEEKIKVEQLKNMINNKTIGINAKYGLQGRYDSTMLLFIGSNGPKCPVPLSGTAVDRRYSTHYIARTGFEVIADKLGVIWVDGKEESPGNIAVRKYYEDNKHKLVDKNVISKWLSILVKKYEKDPYSTPLAFHQEAYKANVIANEPIWETCMKKIFLSKEPEMAGVEHIEGLDLYEIYTLLNLKTNKAAKPLGLKRFYSEADSWLVKNKLPWVRHERTVTITSQGKTFRRGKQVFRMLTQSGQLSRNSDIFYEIDPLNSRITLNDWLLG